MKHCHRLVAPRVDESTQLALDLLGEAPTTVTINNDVTVFIRAVVTSYSVVSGTDCDTRSPPQTEEPQYGI